jgi:hypothetical protein
LSTGAGRHGRHPPGTVDAMSNHKNPGGPWPRMAALAVMAGIVLLASGCGGGSSSNPDASSSPGTSNIAKDVAYSNCMHAHGVNISISSNGSFTGGGGSGGHDSGSQAKDQSAQNACRHLLPSGSPDQSQVAAHQAQALEQDLKYTQCMRSHGMPNFPDPTHQDGDGPITFPGADTGTPAYAKANQACQSLLPGSGS